MFVAKFRRFIIVAAAERITDARLGLVSPAY
jgi:hypothetical protein